MTTNPLVSILIPVYNAEKYLEQCLDSCINQTYKNIEVICVNDGSTDNSLDILNKYKANDNRVKVFSQENSGIAKAYEKAVKEAQGEWIYLLDNDDWLNLKAIEKLIKFVRNKNYDLVYCKKITEFIDDTKQYKKRRIKVYKYKTLTHKKFNNYMMPYKFFKKSLYKNVIFPEKMCDYQDSCLSWQISCNAKQPIETNLNVYYYRVRQNSVSHKEKQWAIHYKTYMKAWNTVKEFLIKSDMWETKKWPVYYWGICQHRHFYKNHRAELPAEIAFNNFKNFINSIDDDIKFLFHHKDEYFILKYLDFESWQEYHKIPSYNIIKRKLYVNKKLKNKNLC